MTHVVWRPSIFAPLLVEADQAIAQRVFMPHAPRIPQVQTSTNITIVENALGPILSGGAGGGGGTTFSAGVSTLGNTSGSTGTVSNQVIFAGINNITLSQSTAAGGSATITISGANQTFWSTATTASQVTTANIVGANASRFALEGHQHEGLHGIIVSGTASTFVGNITFNSGNLISFATAGNSTAGSMSIIDLLSSATTASRVESVNVVGAMASRFALEGHQHAGLWQISVGGNTSGTTSAGAGSFMLAGGPNITLSGSTAAGGETLSISAAAAGGGAAPTLSLWLNQAIGSTSQSQLSNAALVLWPLAPVGDIFGGNMTVSTMFLNLTGTVSTGAAFTRSISIGFYTLVNSTQLSRAFSASTSWGSNGANASFSQSFAGYRWLTFQSSQFDVQPSFSQTQYWLALWDRSSSGSQSFSFYGMSHFVHTSARSGFMSSASNSATTQGWYPFNGNFSISFTTGMPGSIAASDVNKTGSTAVANFFPYLLFNNIGSNIV